MLPEHKNRLQEWYNEQEHTEKPSLDIDQLQELDDKLQKYLNSSINVTLTYHSGNLPFQIQGRIVHCDPIEKKLTLESSEEQRKIKILLDAIMTIEKTE